VTQSKPNWTAFSAKLHALGVRSITGVDRHLYNFLLTTFAGDEFWSEGLEFWLNEYWQEDPQKAVSEVLEVWASNVRGYLARLVPRDRSLLASEDEDPDEIDRPEDMIASIGPNLDPAIVAQLVEAARTPSHPHDGGHRQ
jgi:hypothetical protein